MAFTVIEFAPGLAPAACERATAHAPPCTASPAPYPELLARAGWELRDRIDLSTAFHDISRRELAAFEARSDRLRALLGDSELDERIALRRGRIAGIEVGAIRRELYVARPSATRPST